MVNDCLLDVSSVTILIHEVERSIFAPVETWSIYSLNKFGSDFLIFELPRFSFGGMVGFRRGHNAK